eukprot:CAMPEP_0174258092 /NCGR_PEP_ID=MMETSP0439-20130205/7152_1 /TAXON_ID=0 /ORGANISM="Stereomyxa ramosa, Strain Chinc5" /LENGTH=44 /DNA_ID= /DNA_START= /DNA_END= /DNA_ORIENTATION=
MNKLKHYQGLFFQEGQEILQQQGCHSQDDFVKDHSKWAVQQQLV